jgi:hypothetical protein
VHDLRMSPFFTVNGRLRPCMFDLGSEYHRNYKVITIIQYSVNRDRWISRNLDINEEKKMFYYIHLFHISYDIYSIRVDHRCS